MSFHYVKELKNVRKKDFDSVGGKGANLGEMLGSGLPVPGGFVVLTDAYRKFVRENGLEETISAVFEKNPETPEEIEAAAVEIKSGFKNGTIPAEVAEEIDAIYKKLGEPVTAVRSSATAEDLPGMSFAGQYSSYLNVSGREDLHRAVKNCWASLWNGRAVSYRKKQSIGNHDLAHAVVVQELVDAEKSGILFTANPVNGRRDQILLNSSWGLGEAIVGGDVTPDQWVIQKDTGEKVESVTAEKKVMTLRRKHGIELVEVPDEKQKEVTLDDEECKTLLDLAIKTEDYFGSPQDIEWAYKNGRFHLVQSRPITSLYPLPKKIPGKDGLRIHLNINNYSQAMKEPFTPMGAEVVREMARDLIRRMGRKDPDAEETLWWFQNVGGRIFLDLTEVVRKPKTWRKLENNPADKDPVTSLALLQLLERNREEVTGKKSRGFLSVLNLRILRYLVGAARKFRMGKKSAVNAREAAIEYGDALIRKCREESGKLETIEDRLSFIERSVGELFLKCFEVVFFVSASSRYIEKARKLMSCCFDDFSDLATAEKAVDHSVTTEMGMAILKMAADLDSQGRRATPDCPEMMSFLEKYGHRNTIELDVGIPEWKEDPSYVVDLVNTYIDNRTYADGLNRFESAQREAEAAIPRIREKMEAAGYKAKGKKVEKLLRDFRAMFGVRELSKFYIRHALSIYREQLLKVGEELCAEGRMKDPHDVFFVTFADIRSGENLHETVVQNKETYRKEMNLKAPRIMTSTGESIYSASMEASENTLMGIPVSPGVYEGRVKILASPEESGQLQTGDILVAEGTNPAWTPLFLKLGGLIMETGGPISHGSVVAREYGLPAVAGVVNATTLLKNGEMVRINGETGSVELMESAGSPS